MLLLLAGLALALGQPACSPEEAVATTIEAIRTAPDQWLDKCVTVSGIAESIRLHSSLDTLYRSSQFGEDGNSIDENQRHHIGIDRQELRSNPDLRARATRIEVTGVVDSCERRSERIRAQGGIPFLSGYCHYYGGPTIVISSYTISSERFERLTGQEARGRVGNLIEPPRDWDWRDELESVAHDFAEAVHTGDRARLAAMLSYGPGVEEERIEAVLTSPAYRELREEKPGELKLFTHALGGRFVQRDRDHVGATMCFCRTGDCDGLWPISSLDADAGTGRPYVCIYASGRVRPSADLEVNAPKDGGWLAEPKR